MDQREQAGKSDSFITIWHYEGRDIPMEVIGLSADVKARLAEAFADFILQNLDLITPQISEKP